MRSKHFGSILTVAFLVSAAGHANAFCRTTTCDPRYDDCEPTLGQACTNIGLPLSWSNRCVGYNLQADAATSIPLNAFESVVDRAFRSWLAADCSGQRPSLDVKYLGPVACSAVEYNLYAGNANIIMFREDVWPYATSSHTLALTTVTFNTENAEVYDVDIEINATVPLTTSNSTVQYDLEAILAHEIGHFFGLAHSTDRMATMYANYGKGSLELRSPERDDHQGLCAIYPPKRAAPACDPTPRRGLQNSCGDGSPPDSEGCSCRLSAIGRPTPLGAATIAGLLLLSMFRNVRRRKAQARST